MISLELNHGQLTPTGLSQDTCSRDNIIRSTEAMFYQYGLYHIYTYVSRGHYQRTHICVPNQLSSHHYPRCSRFTTYSLQLSKREFYKNRYHPFYIQTQKRES